VDPRAGLDTEAIGKILYLCQRLNPDRPVIQSEAWVTHIMSNGRMILNDELERMWKEKMTEGNHKSPSQ
jgi:hypothetical protein